MSSTDNSDSLKKKLVVLFRQYPKVLFNLMFFSLLSIGLWLFYTYRGNILTKEDTVKKIIGSLSATQAMDTLAQLMNGNEIKIKEFPHMYTYIVKPKRSIIISKEHKKKTKNYFNTASFSFLPIPNDDCYLFKPGKASWEKKYLKRNKFKDYAVGIYNRNYNYNDNNIFVDLSDENKYQSFLLINRDSCREIRLNMPKDTFDRKMFTYTTLSSESILLQTNVTIVKNEKDSSKNIKSTSDDWDNFYDEETDGITCITEVFFNENDDITQFSHTAVGKQILGHFRINSRSRLITGTKYSTDSIFYINRINRINRIGMPTNSMSIHYNLDSICKVRSPFYEFKKIENVNSEEYTDFATNQKAQKNSLGTSEYYLIYATPEFDKLFLRHLSIGTGNFTETGDHPIIVFDDKVDTIHIRILPGSNCESGGLDKLSWLVLASLDSLQFVFLQPNGKTAIDTSYNIPNSDNGIPTRGNNITMLNRYDRGAIHISNTEFERTNHEDSLFMKKVEFADLYSPQYGNEPEFVAVLPGKMAFVSITRTGKKYNYELIGDKNQDKINWPKDAIDVEAELDYFYLVMLIITVVALYFVLYFMLRRYIPEHEVIMDYSDDIFDRMPFLTMRMKSIENEVFNLKLRSDKMLILGILFGAGGVLASIITFQITNEQIPLEWNNPRTVLGILRPVIMLVFVETFTFYFLKQYRIIYNEYKRFYSLYLNLFSILNIVELNNADIDDSTKHALRKKYASNDVNLLENSTTTAVNEFERDSLLKLIDSLDKFKK